MYTSLYELNNINDDKWNRFHFGFKIVIYSALHQGLIHER